MEIKGNINLLLKKNVKVFTKNDDALNYITCLKRKNKDLKPDKFSIVTWE